MRLSLLRGRRRKTAPLDGEKPGMKIADVLKEPQEGEPCSWDGGSGGRRGRKGSSPIWVRSRSAQKAASFIGREQGEQRRVGCWVFRGGGKGYGVVEEEEEEEEKEGEVEEMEDASETKAPSSHCSDSLEESVKPEEDKKNEGSADLIEEESTVPVVEEKQSSSSDRNPDEVSLSLGVGVGLILLLARNNNYFDKMTEMRNEVESMLKKIREVNLNYLSYAPKDSMDNHLTFHSEFSGEVDGSHLTDKSALEKHDSSSHPTESSAKDNEDAGVHVVCLQDLHALEEEFKSEIELLQTGLDCEQGEDPNWNIEMTANYRDISESSNASSEADEKLQQNEEQELDERCEFGICPHELERRLHVLLQTRQQERIKELENALRLAEEKLLEKDLQISWWRDTAQLVLEQNSEECR